LCINHNQTGFHGSNSWVVELAWSPILGRLSDLSQTKFDQFRT
jgi:hypothetical protein